MTLFGIAQRALLRKLFGQPTSDGTSDSIMPDVTVIRRGDRRRPESFDGEVDAKRQLPQELRDCRNPLPRTGELEDVEQHGDPRGANQRTSDEPQHGHPPWHQAGAVHQVAQYQPVPKADNEAGSEQERLSSQ